MAVYVDGSALSRFFLDVPHAAEWREWAGDRVLELRRSELGVVELRRVTAHLDHSARVVADALIELIREVRFSDQALARAATVEGRLAPFAALHFGVAVAEPDVDAIATYDALLAATCHLHRLRVITPGRPELWWTTVPRPVAAPTEADASGETPVSAPSGASPASTPSATTPRTAASAPSAASPGRSGVPGTPWRPLVTSPADDGASSGTERPVTPRWFSLDDPEPGGTVPE